VYSERYEIMEKFLGDGRRRLLDIGSGPGFFLLNGKNRGWQVKGIEPSVKAAEHSHGLGLDVVNDFFSEETSAGLEHFDAVNMSEVLEHISDPMSLLSLVHDQLNEKGLVCIVVPNDFNPFQVVLRDHLEFKPWWVAPPHHINYFNFKSLSRLVKKCGFEVVHKEATFPIDIFLLMGDNYIGNDELGRKCHGKRMNFEINLDRAGVNSLKQGLYQSMAELGLGREVVLYARKVGL
jgi:SAM-dependent methyltransferase